MSTHIIQLTVCTDFAGKKLEKFTQLLEDALCRIDEQAAGILEEECEDAKLDPDAAWIESIEVVW